MSYSRLLIALATLTLASCLGEEPGDPAQPPLDSSNAQLTEAQDLLYVSNAQADCCSHEACVSERSSLCSIADPWSTTTVVLELLSPAQPLPFDCEGKLLAPGFTFSARVLHNLQGEALSLESPVEITSVDMFLGDSRVLPGERWIATLISTERGLLAYKIWPCLPEAEALANPQKVDVYEVGKLSQDLRSHSESCNTRFQNKDAFVAYLSTPLPQARCGTATSAVITENPPQAHDGSDDN